MRTPFNKGDIVKRVSGGDYPGDGMMIGRCYTVKNIDQNDNMSVEEIGDRINWNANYFELEPKEHLFDKLYLKLKK